ncbi:Ada metal-binding domain-containing protein [Spirosoma koreense]
MIRHTELGPIPYARLRALSRLVKTGAIMLGGHRPGKIYGRLDCRAGKRMKVENRVFFRNESEAVELGYRPCAVCLPEAYKLYRGRAGVPAVIPRAAVSTDVRSAPVLPPYLKQILTGYR